MLQPKELREETLRSSRNYYGRRAAYFDLYVQRGKNDFRRPRESDFIEHAFRTHATRRVKDFLDVPCGGGRQVVGLAERGYRCKGRDFTPERVEAATQANMRGCRMKKSAKFARRIVEGAHASDYFYDTSVASYRPSASNGSRNDLPWIISLPKNDTRALNSLVLSGGQRK